MPSGLPVNREWIIVLFDGTPVIEWGNDLGVDLYTGSFVQIQQVNYGHAIQDEELEMLKKAGHILGFDQRQVYVTSLPELPRQNIA